MDSAEQIRERLAAAIGERYEVLEPIGVGGMATVFLTRHRMHGGFCAVKVLADHLAQQEPLVKSFLTEAQASATLDGHPNIVDIIDIDQRDGLYYMVMKYIEGEDLSSYLNRKGALPWKQSAYIAAQVADGLAYAHDRGVIHRDLKPSNVRISVHGGVTVLDFGIAKIGQTPSTFTEMGARAGTPHYMAPEQIRGQSVDHRSDLYGLGVMLYQMALGRRPFDGENREAIWFAHATDEPPPPREIDPELPEPLSHIILNLLAKDPESRYESASRVARHLRTLGLDDVAESLDPVDQLRVDELRSRTLTPTSLSGERTPIERLSTPSTQTQTRTQQDAPAAALEPPPPAGEADDSRKIMLFAGAAVVLVLAAVAWLVLGSSPEPDPTLAPPPIVERRPPPPAPEPAPASPADPIASSPADPAPAGGSVTPSPETPAEPAGPTAEEQEAERRRAEAARRRRAREAEAKRQAEIEAAKARLRGETPQQ